MPSGGPARSVRRRPVNDLALVAGREREVLPKGPQSFLRSQWIERTLAANRDANCALCTIGAVLGCTSGQVAALLGLDPLAQSAAAFNLYASARVGWLGGQQVASGDEQVTGIDKLLSSRGFEGLVTKEALDPGSRPMDLLQARARMMAYPPGTEFAVRFQHRSDEGEVGAHWIYAERGPTAIRFVDYQTDTGAERAPLEALDRPPERDGVIGPIVEAFGFYAFPPRGVEGQNVTPPPNTRS